MAAVQFGRCGHRGRCRIAVFLVRENVALPLRCGRVVDTLCLQWYAQPEILTATNRLAEAVPGGTRKHERYAFLFGPDRLRPGGASRAPLFPFACRIEVRRAVRHGLQDQNYPIAFSKRNYDFGRL